MTDITIVIPIQNEATGFRGNVSIKDSSPRTDTQEMGTAPCEKIQFSRIPL